MKILLRKFRSAVCRYTSADFAVVRGDKNPNWQGCRLPLLGNAKHKLPIIPSLHSSTCFAPHHKLIFPLCVNPLENVNNLATAQQTSHLTQVLADVENEITVGNICLNMIYALWLGNVALSKNTLREFVETTKGKKTLKASQECSVTSSRAPPHKIAQLRKA